MFSLSPPPVAAEAVGAAKSYLRIENELEDALVERMLGAAIRHVEAFIDQLLLRREGTDRLSPSPAWQKLGVTPVHAITGVRALPDGGPYFDLPVDGYALDIDGNGDGWIRIVHPVNARHVDVLLVAGIAENWDALPEPFRLAVLRLAAHLYTHRDAHDDPGPPAAVAALLRPWRRMHLR